MNGVNVNGSLQLIFVLYTLLIAIVMAYLIVALTVARMDELFKKAELLQTVQNVMNIMEIRVKPIRKSRRSVKNRLKEQFGSGMVTINFER